MDNVAHTLTGWMLARSGLDRSTPGAAVVAMLAANAPDIDVVSGFAGPLAYLHYHRGITHGLAMAPVVALLPPVVARWVFRRKIRWIGAYLLSILGVLSHLLLDWTNVYGTRLLEPFSGRWLRLDITFVADPWIWAALFLALAAPALARLVSAEIGARPGSGRGWAVFALAFLAVYDYGRWLAHERALATLEARLYQGAAPRRVTAIPVPANPLRWIGVVEGAGFVSIHTVDLLTEFDPTTGPVYYLPEPSPALEAARRSEVFQEFLRYSQLPFWRVTPLLEATCVEVMDLRFGTPMRPGFVASAVVDGLLQVKQSSFSFAPRNPR